MKTGLQVIQVVLLVAILVFLFLGNGPEEAHERPSEPSDSRAVEELSMAVGRLEEKVPANLHESIETMNNRLDDVATQVFEFQHDAQRDHMTLQSTILRRIASLSAPAKSQADTDPRALVTKLAARGVELNLTARRVKLKGILRTPSRPLECVAVNEGGPVHEALLVTDCTPSDLRTALMAIGAKSGRDDTRPGRTPTGTSLTIYISWQGLKKPWRLQDVIQNLKTEDSMKSPGWVFSGSKWSTEFRTGREFYVPDAARVAIALCYKFADQAVISASNPLCANELIWMPYGDLLPDEAEVSVVLTIALEPIPEMERKGVQRAPAPTKEK